MIRVFDVLIGCTLVLLAGPIVVFVLALVWLVDKHYPIFIQERVGLRGKIFKMYKIKTMRGDAEISDQERLTDLGRFLRKSSIDEIPQLINVVRGDMSMVGPRPLPRDAIDRIDVAESVKIKRQRVRPGLTGYSQIRSKGSRRSQKEKIQQDMQWVDNKSLSLYIRICLRTLGVLVVRYKNNKEGSSL